MMNHKITPNGIPNDSIAAQSALAVTTGTTISANGGGSGQGDGGTVILWADENANILGDISARPGADAGEGGFIEVSAGSDLRILTDTITAGGGTVLFDPRNITIADAADIDQSGFILGTEFSSTVSLTSSLGAGDNFGAAVALDGTRMAVGAPGDDGRLSDATDAGAVYLFTFGAADLSGGRLEAVLGKGYFGGKNRNTTNTGAGDRFGSAVALDANRLVVGAPGDDGRGDSSTDTGAVYLFNFSGEAFSAIGTKHVFGANYIGSKGVDVDSDAFDAFGTSLALDGKALAVGAFGGRTNSGAVHHMAFNDEFTVASNLGRLAFGNILLHDLNLTGLEPGDNFGSALAFDGERLAVGALGDDGLNNQRFNSGAVHLFDVPGGNSSQIKFNSLVGRGYQEANVSGTPSTAVASLDATDSFGSAVALDGTRMIVGAPKDDGQNNAAIDVGKVYSYVLEDGDATALNQINIIGDSHFGDGTALSLDANDLFGTSVSLDQGRIVIGAEGDDGAFNRARDTGAVYLYTTGFDGLGDLTLQGVIGKGYLGGKNVDVAELRTGDRFGSAVSLDGARLAVGAQGDDGSLNDNPDIGIVYLFTFASSLFNNGRLDKTIGGDARRKTDIFGNVTFGPIDRENFGASVALQDNLLFVGAPGRGVGGSVEAFSFAFRAFSNLGGFAGPDSLGVIGDGLPVSSINGNNQINLDNGDAFGAALSFDGTRLLVGAPG